MGVFDRLRQSLRRTTQDLADRLDGVLARPDATHDRKRPIGLETIEALEEALISADVGVAAADRVIATVRGARGDGPSVRDLVKAEIRAILEAVERPTRNGHVPRIILVVGVNGTGKTTTVGRLACLLKTAGGRPLVCAGDTFRAAAAEQLEIWAERAGVDVIRGRDGADPAAVVFDAIASSRARGRDSVIIDTAGRLHTRVNLMRELQKITRVASREVEGAPHEVLLVLDATVGQNGVVQAREFLQAAGVTGIALTKLDGTARGGIAVAIAADLRLPVRYVGIGEGLEDLVPFSAEVYVDALFEERW